MVCDAANARFVDAERGILAKFDHQYFLLALIAHFHRAALMAFRDRLVTAMSLLSDYAPETVKAFKCEIRLTHENFLRFAHRYWFSEISTQGPAHEIFARWVNLLGTDCLFAEVREEANDMMDYLDSDGLRRQANSVVRLDGSNLLRPDRHGYHRVSEHEPHRPYPDSTARQDALSHRGSVPRCSFDVLHRGEVSAAVGIPRGGLQSPDDIAPEAARAVAGLAAWLRRHIAERSLQQKRGGFAK